VVNGILNVEAVRVAQRKYGNKPLTGEQVRWGFEHLNLDDARLRQLGALGLVQPPSCRARTTKAAARCASSNGTAASGT
jgi:branched-chain amino acid transport system substrate-binding protein